MDSDKPIFQEPEREELNWFKEEFKALLQKALSKGHSVDCIGECAEEVLQCSWD